MREYSDGVITLPHQFYALKAPDWCNIIPITAEGNIVFVKQYRAGTDTITLEIPGGGTHPSEQDIKDAATRELIEETGYVPDKNARCDYLGFSHPNPAVFNNRCHMFVIGPVSKVQEQNLDPAERIEVMELTPAELFDFLKDGTVSHAMVLAAFAALTKWGTRTLSDSIALYK